MPTAELLTATLPTGATVAYTDDGPRDADITIVFSHGFLMDHRMFEAQGAGLADTYQVVTWDERGHGETPDVPAPFSYWDSAADALALLEHLGVERAVLAGMSQGGFLSLRAALTAPERVAGLVLIDSQAGSEDPEKVDGYDAMNHVWLTHGPNDDLVNTVASIIIGDNEYKQRWTDIWKARPKESFEHIYRTLMDRDDITERLPEIGCPVLVLHGTADVAIAMERAEIVAAAVPDCRGLVRIDGGTHASNMTHPDETNAAIRAFLDDL